uniref:Uncharacterized protein n=1 Tax=Rhodopseudomonas palustris (strain BisA53) TaxID=316055 RepID=Q07MK6_RHOP5
MDRIKTPRSLRSDWHQLEHAAVFRRFGEIATAEGEAGRLKPFGVNERHRRRPAFIVVMQLDFNLGGVAAFMDELNGFSGPGHRFRLLKSSDHRTGSGR